MPQNPINKVVFGNNTVIDLSGDSLENPSDLASGVTAHNRNGVQITGTGSGGGGSTMRVLYYYSNDTLVCSKTYAELMSASQDPTLVGEYFFADADGNSYVSASAKVEPVSGDYPLLISYYIDTTVGLTIYKIVHDSNDSITVFVQRGGAFIVDYTPEAIEETIFQDTVPTMSVAPEPQGLYYVTINNATYDVPSDADSKQFYWNDDDHPLETVETGTSKTFKYNIDMTTFLPVDPNDVSFLINLENGNSVSIVCWTDISNDPIKIYYKETSFDNLTPSMSFANIIALLQADNLVVARVPNQVIEGGSADVYFTLDGNGTITDINLSVIQFYCHDWEDGASAKIAHYSLTEGTTTTEGAELEITPSPSPTTTHDLEISITAQLDASDNFSVTNSSINTVSSNISWSDLMSAITNWDKVDAVVNLWVSIPLFSFNSAFSFPAMLIKGYDSSTQQDVLFVSTSVTFTLDGTSVSTVIVTVVTTENDYSDFGGPIIKVIAS